MEFFEELIKEKHFYENSFPTKEAYIAGWDVDGYMENEIDRLKKDLRNTHIELRNVLIEDVMHGLLTGITNLYNMDDERNTNIYPDNGASYRRWKKYQEVNIIYLHEALSHVINLADNYKIEYSNKFIDKWEALHASFPCVFMPLPEYKIPNVYNIHDKNELSTTYVDKAYYEIVVRSKDYRFVPIHDVYVCNCIIDMLGAVERAKLLSKGTNIEQLIAVYVLGFKSGYRNFKQIINTGIEANKALIFQGSVRKLDLNKLAFPKLDDDKKIILEATTIKKLGEDIGKFYCAWCIIEQNQKIFEPLFEKQYSQSTVEPLQKKEIEPKQKKESSQTSQKTNFRNRVISENDAGRVIKNLHNMLEGKKGKDVALIIQAAIKRGLITRPSSREVENEFGDIGDKSGYNHYMRYKFTNEELTPIISQL
jgi:hypothetical protein